MFNLDQSRWTTEAAPCRKPQNTKVHPAPCQRPPIRNVAIRLPVRLHVPLPVAAQGDIDIVPEEAAERHVPAPPEIGDVQRLVGRVEVDGQADVEHERRGQGHVGVGGEIEIDLEGIGQARHPRFRAGEGAGRVEAAVGDAARCESAMMTFLNSPMKNRNSAWDMLR